MDNIMTALDAQVAILESKVNEHERMLKGNGGDGIDTMVTQMDVKIESIQYDLGWIKKGILTIIVGILVACATLFLTRSI